MDFRHLAPFGLIVTSYREVNNQSIPIVSHIFWGNNLTEAITNAIDHLKQDALFNGTFRGNLSYNGQFIGMDTGDDIERALDTLRAAAAGSTSNWGRIDRYNYGAAKSSCGCGGKGNSYFDQTKTQNYSVDKPATSSCGCGGKGKETLFDPTKTNNYSVNKPCGCGGKGNTLFDADKAK